MDNAPQDAPPPPDGADGGTVDGPQTAPPADDGPRLDVRPPSAPEPPKQDVKPADATSAKAAAVPDAPAVPSPQAAPLPSAQDDVFFHGSVSLWLGWRAILGAVVSVLLGLALLIVGLVYAGWWHPLGIYIGLPLALAGALMFGYVWLSLRCLRYKITARLIERERGILVKRVDSLDLGRVKDVQLVQNLMERILRIGTIEILSSDRSDPLMRIEAIPGPRPVYEKLRDTVIRISQKRGIIAMDR
jgi:membrane protein YdbS with pleckstrin-like domain